MVVVAAAVATAAAAAAAAVVAALLPTLLGRLRLNTRPQAVENPALIPKILQDNRRLLLPLHRLRPVLPVIQRCRPQYLQDCQFLIQTASRLLS